MQKTIIIFILILFAAATFVYAQETTITVHADQVLHRVSRYLTGACIEDVNHEVYGGIDSQMIFGESFAEPAPQPPLKGFDVFGGRWTLGDEECIRAVGSDGAKIVSDGLEIAEGEASVDVWLTENAGGNGGLILKVSDPGIGADQFNGYEVALERPGMLVLGRHRHNWEPIRRVPCDVPVNQWITLSAKFTTKTLEIFVNGKSITKYEDTEHPLETGRIGLRSWQHDARFRNFLVTANGAQTKIPFELERTNLSQDEVSGAWQAIRLGTVEGSFSLESKDAFIGKQSQKITYTGGSGFFGIENRSLNRWGMNFEPGKKYEGYLYVRSDKPLGFSVALESMDGNRIYAESYLTSKSDQWHRLDFSLETQTADCAGRFAINLNQPGTLLIGYAFLQPGEWGRFKGLPVRIDVAEGLIDQGITVLRQGGCMANAAEYRWKKMIGPRAFRPPYEGWWHPNSSNGWGIIDFLNFCEAADFLGIPDFNAGESPQDMLDFIEYVNGPADSEWGKKRVADGHPKPYYLKHLQFGNEEQVNEVYWEKFKPVAEALWAKYPEFIIVVGDFAYGKEIKDPFNFTGAAGRITSLEVQKKILQLAKQYNSEVWFDVHINTEGPRPDFGGTISYIDAIDKIADGAKHRVVIFEFNAGNHSQKRALANAAAINAAERDGRLPIAISANCLQPDGQNDNDWDQGLLFLNPAQVWLQPPGYVTQMVSNTHQPLAVKNEVHSTSGNDLDVSATKSEDNKTLVLKVVNFEGRPVMASIKIAGFPPEKKTVLVRTLAASLDAKNTASNPKAVIPELSGWVHGLDKGDATWTFPAHSFTVIEF